MGASKLILACRNPRKGEAAAAVIRKLPKARKDIVVAVWDLDLDSHDSVVAFCTRVCSTAERVDGLILNAGVEMKKFEMSEGLERSITINVVSTIMLAVGVLPKLQATARSFNTATHLTIVGSLVHFFGLDEQLNIPNNILTSLSNPQTADMPNRYNLSKLMLHLCFNEMIARSATDDDFNGSDKTQVIVNVVNPGWCATELFRNSSAGLMERIMFRLIGRTGEEGSRALVHGVVAGVTTHGCYLSECTPKPQSSFVRSPRGYAARRRLWEEVAQEMKALAVGGNKSWIFN